MRSIFLGVAPLGKSFLHHGLRCSWRCKSICTCEGCDAFVVLVQGSAIGWSVTGGQSFGFRFGFWRRIS